MENTDLPTPLKASDTDAPEDLVRIGGAVDRVSVTLRFFGESLVPEEVTHLLGAPPAEARRKGDVIPSRRHPHVASTGMWLLGGTQPESVDLEAQVLALLASVTSDLQVWRRLTEEFSADVFCGVFLDEPCRGFSLSPRVMQMLAERGLEIGFDIYSP